MQTGNWFKLSALASWLAAVMTSRATPLRGGEAPRAIERPSFETVLGWLPTDTERLYVARSYPLLEPDLNKSQVDDPKLPQSLLRAWAGPLNDGQFRKLLEGKQLALTVAGSRAMWVFDFWGNNRYEGAFVYVFAQDLGSAGTTLERDWTRTCKSSRTVAGETVYDFAPPPPGKPYIKREPWEGIFICRPAANVVMVATQEAYLTTILQRRRFKPRDRALPDDLPLWKDVDRQATAWAVRHIKKRVGDKWLAAAWTLAVSKSGHGFSLCYSPDAAPSRAAAAEAADRINGMARRAEIPTEFKAEPDGRAQMELDLSKWKRPPNEEGMFPDLRLVNLSFFLNAFQIDPVIPDENTN
jgi:hypothetical protein